VREGGGDPGVQVAGPVAAVAEGELGGGAGAAVLGEQGLVLGLLGGPGGDDLQQLAAQALEVAGSEVGGLGDQVRVTLLTRLGVQVLGEPAEGLEDLPGLGQVDPTGAQGGGDPVPGSGGELLPEPGLPDPVTGGLGQPVPDRPAPVWSAMSPATARTRSRAASARAITADRSVRRVCFSPVVR